MTDRQRTGDDSPGGSAAAVAVAVVAALGLVVAAVVVAAPPTARDTGAATPEAGPQAPDDGNRTVVRDVSGSTTVWITYETAGERGTFVVEDRDPRYADARHDWAVVPRSALPEALAGLAGNHSAGVAVVGEYALVGTLGSATARLDDGPLTVVAPAGLGVDPARKADFIEQFLSPYDLRPGDTGPATLLAVPEALPARGVTYGTTGYVAAPYFWDGDAGSVWIHEAVHTRQTVALDRGMGWFREASAQYLAYRVMAEQYGEVTDADVRARLAALPRYPDAALSDPSTWRGESVDYRRGARLLYAVDATIRAASDGRRSLVDVLRAANGREDSLTLGEFVRLVERAAGRQVEWIRPAVTGTGPIGEYLPDVDRGVFHRWIGSASDPSPRYSG